MARGHREAVDPALATVVGAEDDSDDLRPGVAAGPLPFAGRRQGLGNQEHAQAERQFRGYRRSAVATHGLERQTRRPPKDHDGVVVIQDEGADGDRRGHHP